MMNKWVSVNERLPKQGWENNTMYDIKDPKFFIKFSVDITFFENLKTGEFDEDIVSFQLENFSLAFRNRFKGIRFKIETKKDGIVKKLRLIICFERQLHKTVVKKMLDWIKKHYPVSDLDICWGE